jgi:ADP-ribose pyrophosphatase YjhB (NUDIX family)
VLFYRAWRHTPHAVRAVAVWLAIPRAPSGAALLLFDDAGRLLLVRHSYQRERAWSLPGGWAKRDEDLRRTAEREGAEELGVDLCVGVPLATSRGRFGDVSVAFEASLASSRAELKLDAEIAEARFFALDELPPLFGHARRLVEEALTHRARFT